MLQTLMVALLGLPLAVLAWADDPKPKADPKPQWQRLLTGDDARRAAELDKRIGEHESADRYADAIIAQEEVLALRTRVQGDDHWETVIEKWALAALKKVATLPAEERRGWRKAVEDAAEAVRLEENAQYAKALPLRQEQLKWCREVLGEGYPDTATSYNQLAYNLHRQGKYAEAEPLFRKALDLQRQAVGEGHPLTASAYCNLAINLGERWKHAEAGPLLQTALDIYRRALGEDHPATARAYNNVAANLNRQGKYAEAGPLFQAALDICRRTLGEDHPNTAESYNSLAVNLAHQRKYAEAGSLAQRALDIRRKTRGEDHPDTARSYSHVAGILHAQGRYAEAGPLAQKALDIIRRALGEDHPDTVAGYNNVAADLQAQGKYAEAGPLLQKALDIGRRSLGEDHPNLSASYHHVAADLQAQGKYAEAGPLLQKALDIKLRSHGQCHPDTAACYYNFAHNLHAQGRYAEALESLGKCTRSYEAARLAMAAGGLERAPYGAENSPHAFLAAALGRAGQATEAWVALEADLGRGLRDEMAHRRGVPLTAAEEEQRDNLPARRTALDARVLALVSRPQRADAEAAELERLIGERQQLEKSLGELAATVGRREVATLEQLRTALSADAGFVAWVDVNDNLGIVQEHWGCVVRARGEPMWERLPGSGPAGKWTKDDHDLLLQFRKALAKSAPAAEVEALARRVRDQRLAPLGKHLSGVKRLFVAPVNRMAGIPVEALTDQYTVSYTPSGTYLARLKGRERPHGTGLLAVGDPLFPPVKEAAPPTALPPGGLLITQVVPDSSAAKARLRPCDVLVAYAGEELTSQEQLGKLIAARAGEATIVVKVWREGQEKLAERELPPGRLGVLLANEPARQAITTRRQTDQMLAKLTRGDGYAELPGTQVEIARLTALFDAKMVTKLTRADATEERLDELRKAGALKQYRYLHLAMHAQANDVRAFDSALILTRPANLPEPRVGEPYLDGRLTAAEVLEYWKLDAELLTLSACETGLGRPGGGDGLLGFAQAFLLAGSRSVCLTLWQVDDTATALLMDRFYRNLLGKREDGARPLPKAEALREAKQWLRNLTAAEALDRLGALTQGVVRGERPAREEMHAVPRPEGAAEDYKPYAHPRYWAAFILIGDPD
jgi:tetratricopeptide (TPR) repeat protein